MKYSLRFAAASLLVVFALAGCSNVLIDETTGSDALLSRSPGRAPAAENTIVDIASSSEDFEILTQAVIFAGLADELNGRRKYTVFAPTDDAFVALLASLGLTADQLFAPGNESLVRSILLYHVVPGERFAEDVVTSDRLNTLLREFAFVEVTEDGAFVGNETYGFAQIVLTDIVAGNGVIHVIDAVLLQPSLTL